MKKIFIEELKEVTNKYYCPPCPALKDIIDYALKNNKSNEYVKKHVEDCVECFKIFENIVKNNGIIPDDINEKLEIIDGSIAAVDEILSESNSANKPEAGEIWSLRLTNSKNIDEPVFVVVVECKSNSNYMVMPISFNIHLCCGREILIPSTDGNLFFKKSYMIMCCSKFECSKFVLAEKIGEVPKWDSLKIISKVLAGDNECETNCLNSQPEDIAYLLVEKYPSLKTMSIGLSDNIVLVNKTPIIDTLDLQKIIEQAYENGFIILLHRADRYDVVDLVKNYHKYVNYALMSCFASDDCIINPIVENIVKKYLKEKLRNAKLEEIVKVLNALIYRGNSFKECLAFCAADIKLSSELINKIKVISQERSSIVKVLKNSDNPEAITVSRVVLREGGLYYVIKAEPNIDLRDRNIFNIKYSLGDGEIIELSIDYDRSYSLNDNKKSFVIIGLNCDILPRIEIAGKQALNVFFVFNVPELVFSDNQNSENKVEFKIINITEILN